MLEREGCRMKCILMVSIKSKVFEVVCCQSVMSELIVSPGQVLLWHYLVEEVNHSRALCVCVCVCVQCVCVCVCSVSVC